MQGAGARDGAEPREEIDMFAVTRLRVIETDAAGFAAAVGVLLAALAARPASGTASWAAAPTTRGCGRWSPGGRASAPTAGPCRRRR